MIRKQQYSQLVIQAAAIAIIAYAASAQGAIPNLINYSGRLTDTAGLSLTGSFAVQFTIYDAPTGGIVFWQETQTVAANAGGLFRVLLGSVIPVLDTVFQDNTRYLGIRVGSDPEMTPRIRLASVPYAARVSTIDGSSGGTVSGSIAVGTPPAQPAGLSAQSAKAFGGYFTSSLAANTTHALHGECVGTGIANAIGVFGRSITNNGYGIGGSFEGGLIGIASHANSNGRPSTGIYSLADGSGSGSSNIALNSTAMDGETDNTGVFGQALNGGTNAKNYGVSGTASALPGQLGIGVYGSTTTPIGGDLWAGYFAGRTRVTGDLFVDGFIHGVVTSFRIDHPLDPGNKYLQHSAVSSPDMMNIYNGNVVTDAKGVAKVALPDYFEALNTDYRYQLTAIGQFAQAIISQKISGNHFEIQTDKPNVEVSWQVTGIRNDAVARDKRISVEVAKSGKEQGKYLYPAGLGYSDDRSLTYQLRQDAQQVQHLHSMNSPITEWKTNSKK